MRHARTRRLGLSAGLPPFLLGFMASVFQVYFLREFSAEFYGNELTLGLVLGSWLLWGGLGSLVRPPRRTELEAARLYGLYALTVLLFIAALAALRFSHRFLGLLPAELTGLGPALGAALIMGLLVSFPLGRAFVLNAGLLGGDVPRVYLLESAGAAAGGLAVHFLLVPRLSNWQGAAVVAGGLALAAAAGARRAGVRVLAAAGLVAAGAVVLLDRPSQQAAWRPLRLIEAVDSPYGKLQAIRTGDQVTLFDNGLPLFSSPDPGAAEESVHFALLQREDVGQVLLIGGGPGGPAEVIKYPGVRLDYVELDPAVIRMAKKSIAAAEMPALDNPRVRVISQDGRAFLAQSGRRYDAVLLNLPEPATAQVNRYYTREFFRVVRAKLAPRGVFSFVVPSAENYVSDILARFLGSLAATLREAFEEVVVVPGANAVFLASDAPLSIDPARLSEALLRRGLKNRLVSAEMLPARLNAWRVEALTRKLSEGRPTVNRDLAPVSYYFHSMLWASQFRGLESRLLGGAGRIPAGWLLDAPLAMIACGLALLAVKKRNWPGRFLAPIAVMGFTTIVVELALFIAFQANFGFVYGRIPLLVALFMAGLSAGSLLAGRRKAPNRSFLSLVQGGFIIVLGLTLGTLSGKGGEFVPFVLLFAFGALGGSLFALANRLLLRETPHPGLGYGVDLLASFAGVIAASALVIPIWGIPAVIIRLAVLNAISLAFLLATGRSSA